MNLITLVIGIVLAVIEYVVVSLVAPFWLAVVAALLVLALALAQASGSFGRTRV